MTTPNQFQTRMVDITLNLRVIVQQREVYPFIRTTGIIEDMSDPENRKVLWERWADNGPDFAGGAAVWIASQARVEFAKIASGMVKFPVLTIESSFDGPEEATASE
jgi:hypothetical protein